jgi:hypothetical protein
MTQGKVTEVANKLFQFAKDKAQEFNIPFGVRQDFIYKLAMDMTAEIGMVSTDFKNNKDEKETLFCADVYVFCKRVKRKLEIMQSKGYE